MMSETLAEFRARMRCAHTSYEQIERWYYEQGIELDVLRADYERLRVQLYSTQCRECAGQGMPTKAPLYCNHCGEAFVRMMPNAVPEGEMMAAPAALFCNSCACSYCARPFSRVAPNVGPEGEMMDEQGKQIVTGFIDDLQAEAKALRNENKRLRECPIQPIGLDESGILRFRANKIVCFLLDAGPFDLNQLACMPFSQQDREQFAQLIGYSVSGYGDLSYVSSETRQRVKQCADRARAELEESE